jgi:DNA-binding GntR family transcriptional regulator
MAGDPVELTALETRFGSGALRTEIRQRLRDAIVEGRLKPGEHIVESRLAKQLGISQTPVREALRELEHMGLVVNQARRGTFVRELTAEDAWEVYTLRAHLETMAARLAVARASDDDVARMSDLMQTMLQAARRDDEEEFTRADAGFHELLCEMSGHKLLLRVWRSIHPLNWTQLTVATLKRDLVELAERHGEILEALRSRDSDAVERAVQQHVLSVGEEVTRDLKWSNRRE